MCYPHLVLEPVGVVLADAGVDERGAEVAVVDLLLQQCQGIGACGIEAAEAGDALLRAPEAT